MSVRRVDAVVVMPVGPNDDALDTAESLVAYLAPPRAIVVVDDTRGEGADMAAVAALSPDIDIIAPVQAPAGTYGGLFVKVCAAIRHARAAYDFDLLIRFDADALLLGSGIETAAHARFAADRRVGLLGSYRVNAAGQPRDFAPAADVMRRELGWRTGNRTLRRLVRAARRHSYVLGEHPLASAAVFSRSTIDALADRGWLDLPGLATSRAGDDHLLALLVRAAGFEIGDFGGPGDPMALAWKGLPYPPEDLLARGTLVTHSVRSWGDRTEPEIRAVFRHARRR